MIKLAFFFTVSTLFMLSGVSEAHDFQSTICTPVDDLQKCISNGAGGRVNIAPGLYAVDKIDLPASTTIHVAEKAIIRLRSDVTMPDKGGYIVGIRGAADKPISSVIFILDGTIDGNKRAHYLADYGYEGINVQ